MKNEEFVCAFIIAVILAVLGISLYVYGYGISSPCPGDKAASVESYSNIALKKQQCHRILNAPDFIQESLKNLNPEQVEFDDFGNSSIQTCKPFETIVCDGIEYRLYDVCFPSRRIVYTIAIEEDYL